MIKIEYCPYCGFKHYKFKILRYTLRYGCKYKIM